MTPDALAALHRSCFTTPRPWSETEFAALLADPLVFMVAADAPCYGFALGRAVAGEAELLTLAVLPALRRQGLGRSLLAAFEARAAEAGASDAFLEVASDNGAALALYQSAGWQRRGLRRGYYCHPDGASVDAVVMGKPLRGG